MKHSAWLEGLIRISGWKVRAFNSGVYFFWGGLGPTFFWDVVLTEVNVHSSVISGVAIPG